MNRNMDTDMDSDTEMIMDKDTDMYMWPNLSDCGTKYNQTNLF
jgi:hypothetical protein